MLNQIDLSRTDLNLLVLFETVLAKGHVGHAAAVLNLSPSAVSHGLGRLRRLLNDPLFLRTPRGVTPTDRALELSPRIAEILQGVRGVLGTAEPFDPATSTRRFRIGTPDSALAVHGPLLVQQVGAEAPGVGLSLLHILPNFRTSPGEGAFTHVLDQLDDRSLDLAAIPQLAETPLPARFLARSLGGDRLVAVCRPDHPFARAPSLETYCDARHVFMSLTGDRTGVIDTVLARMDRQRDVITTVPNAMLALLMAASTDLVAGVPSSLAEGQAARFGLVANPLPFDLDLTPLYAVVTRAAHSDAGIAWLLDQVTRAMWLGPA
ncbi:LysR family transcriptional regulator [Tabrizicola sp.]|uniref:LysR family transcriptional regulator n=1 Tax=Tabrizicola sp. TaxID=2005166 RepID=UPI003F41AAB2